MTKVPAIISACLCFLCLGCNDQHPTPDKYKNHTIVDRMQYEHNRAEIKDSIEMLIERREGPFYPKENDSLTGITVDTILYSPKKERYATFIITKNSNDKLLDKGNKSDYHYNAYCFIGRLTSDLHVEYLTWISAHILVLYKSLEEASSRIRAVYFKEITLRTDLGSPSTFKYNFDDIRFWDGLAILSR